MIIVIMILAIIPNIEDLAIAGTCGGSADGDLEDLVFTIPSSLISYIHENINMTGKPKITNTTMKLIVQSGICRAGIKIAAACNIKNEVARYIAAVLNTFLFFNY